MIKFFRHIRRSLITENKMGKYFKYAIGEILLVVIGILIALQLNNWNQKRQEANTINFYLEKLVDEVDEQIIITERYIPINDSLSKMQTRTLEILVSKNEDDIPELTKNIGAVATAFDRKYSLETFNEFQEQGLLSQVNNEELKQLLKDLELYLIRMKSGDEYAVNQYNNLIEPYFSKHINYATNALPMFKEGFTPGGPKTNYKALFNSMEFWNIVTFKLETTNSNLNGLNRMLGLLKALKSSLEKELGHD